MYNKNIANFGIDTNKYSWLSPNTWDEKQIQYFYTNQFILPINHTPIPFIKDKYNKNRFFKINLNSWILTEKYYKNDKNTELDSSTNVKAIFSIRSFNKIYNRLEASYKFFIDENTDNLEEIKDIFHLMISALFIVYKADTIEFFNLESSSFYTGTEQLFSTEIVNTSLVKDIFTISKDYSLKPEKIYTVTANNWKEFRKDDEKRLFYLKSLFNDTNIKNNKNKIKVKKYKLF